MRKKTLFAASLALMVLMAACTEKEGVYNPKKKISKVYKSSVSHYGQYDPETGTLYNQNTHRQDKQLWEEWIWEGNKLTQIRVYENEIEPPSKEEYAAINFIYDGKQIQRIESADEYMSTTARSCSRYKYSQQATASLLRPTPSPTTETKSPKSTLPFKTLRQTHTTSD